MADFGHIFLLTGGGASGGGKWGGAEPQLGGKYPHGPPPLDAATG